MKKKKRNEASEIEFMDSGAGEVYKYFDDDLEEEDDYFEREVSQGRGYDKRAVRAGMVRDAIGEILMRKSDAHIPGAAHGGETQYLDDEEADEYAEEQYEEDIVDEYAEEDEYFDDEHETDEYEEDVYEEAEYEVRDGYEEETEYEEADEYGAECGRRYGSKRYREVKKHRAARQKKGIRYRVKHMNIMDRVVASTGVLILAGAIVTGILYANGKRETMQVASFAEVGTQMEGITVIGESGLLAMADAQNTKAVMEETDEKTSAVMEYEEKELNEKGSIEVEMHVSSVQKDLKMKFVNKKTGKLIPSVPFEVTIAGADKKSYVLKDEDMDGIIYQADVAPGTCSVAMLAIENAEEYVISTESISVTVKDKIEYKKVDVTDEIKKESEVNAAVEDTKRALAEESALTDTVGFVASTKMLTEETSSAIENGEYEEVSKDKVIDPAAVAGGSNEENQGEGGGEDDSESQVLTLNMTEGKIYTGKTLQLIANVQGMEDKSVTWTSDNNEVAAVAEDGMITGVNEGTATIVAVCNGNREVTASCIITVNADPAVDHTTKLVDYDNNQLYVIDEEGNFKEAVYADYYTADKFYKKMQEAQVEEKYEYTGWQTIDGKTYYYDADGNKVTGEQVIQGAKYIFDEDGVLSTASGNMGIDVSRWNGSIDWNAVKNSGVSYAIIRCGYRGSTTGALIEDSTFRTNIQGAASAGLKVGIYFVTQAVNEVEAVEEASMVAGLISGYHISYPVFLDVEPSGGRADSISKETRTTVCRAFCQTIENSGYTAGIYANSTWLKEKIDTPSLTNYKIWLAQYTAEPSYSATKYDLWQYSAKGTVAGIAGETDLNISYLD